MSRFSPAWLTLLAPCFALLAFLEYRVVDLPNFVITSYIQRPTFDLMKSSSTLSSSKLDRNSFDEDEHRKNEPLEMIGMQVCIVTEIKKLEEQLVKKNHLIKYLERKCGNQIIQSTKKLKSRILALESENQALRNQCQYEQKQKLGVCLPAKAFVNNDQAKIVETLVKNRSTDFETSPNIIKKLPPRMSLKSVGLASSVDFGAKKRSMSKKVRNIRKPIQSLNELKKMSVDQLYRLITVQASELNRISKILEGSPQKSCSIEKMMKLRQSKENIDCSNMNSAFQNHIALTQSPTKDLIVQPENEKLRSVRKPFFAEMTVSLKLHSQIEVIKSETGIQTEQNTTKIWSDAETQFSVQLPEIQAQTDQTYLSTSQLEASLKQIRLENEQRKKQLESLKQKIQISMHGERQYQTEEKQATLSDMRKGQQTINLPFQIAQILLNYKEILQIFGIQVPATTDENLTTTENGKLEANESADATAQKLFKYHSVLVEEIWDMKSQITKMIQQFKKAEIQSNARFVRLEEAENHIKYQDEYLLNIEANNKAINSMLEEVNEKIMGLNVCLLGAKYYLELQTVSEESESFQQLVEMQ